MLLPFFNADWDYWELRHKITFDGPNRIIQVNKGVTALDVETEIYSPWKEWSMLQQNTKFPQAMRSTGGDPLPGGDKLGATFFLLNGWKIRTWEGDHTLTVFGNIYSEDGSDPYIQTEGNHTIVVRNRVSNLVNKINTGGGGSGDYPTADEIADAVWDSLIDQHNVSGSFGEKLGRTSVYVNQGDLIIESDD